MTTRTRYFIVVSSLILVVGLGTGLVAHFVGLPMAGFGRADGPDDLRLVPADATLVAYANVRDVMNSDLRQRLKKISPDEKGQEELRNQTGINIETDIDTVVASLSPADQQNDSNVLVTARGRFDETRIEALIREHGGQVETYQGKRMLSYKPELDAAVREKLDEANKAIEGAAEATGKAAVKVHASKEMALAFVEPGLVAFGSGPMVRKALDLGKGGPNITGNTDMMRLVKANESSNAWAVGRFDALRAQAKLPAGMASQIPPISWFSVSGHLNGGVSAVFKAETGSDEAAQNLRDVIKGFMALAKLSAGSKPEMQAMMQTLELGGTGRTVALSVSIPAQVLDLIPQSHPRRGGDKAAEPRH